MIQKCKDEKQKLVEDRKRYYKMREDAFLQLQETVILKGNKTESSFDKEYIKLRYIKIYQNGF